MAITRRATKPVVVRGVQIGGGAPVSIQSMTKFPLSDVERTVLQIEELMGAGCQIVRLAVPDTESAEALKKVRSRVDAPLVADIHFDYRLALLSIGAGVDKLRINPGNLGGDRSLREVALAAKDKGIPIRVGINGGSLERDILARFGGPTPEAIAESALRNVSLLTDLGFLDIVISAKSSDVMHTVEAYRIIASCCDFPLHIGITETGPGEMGLVKSAVGIGALLASGIGDTIRVSLTAPAVYEVHAARMILDSLRLRDVQVNLVSCPTCGRTRGPLMDLARKVMEASQGVRKRLTIAIMGCEVNGPGEAKEADLGLALTRSGAVLFEKGSVVSSGTTDDMFKELLHKIADV